MSRVRVASPAPLPQHEGVTSKKDAWWARVRTVSKNMAGEIGTRPGDVGCSRARPIQAVIWRGISPQNNSARHRAYLPFPTCAPHHRRAWNRIYASSNSHETNSTSASGVSRGAFSLRNSEFLMSTLRRLSCEARGQAFRNFRRQCLVSSPPKRAASHGLSNTTSAAPSGSAQITPASVCWKVSLPCLTLSTKRGFERHPDC